MKTAHLPRVAGIYRITNNLDGRFYVGSAVNIQKRLHSHRRELGLGNHANVRMQRAWRKYGSISFSAEVLEIVQDLERLIEREQHWLNLTGAVSKGYNLAPVAGSSLGVKARPETLMRQSRRARPVAGFITPDGAQLTLLHVKDFCKANGLTPEAMWGMSVGKVTSHKGWSHINAKAKQHDRLSTMTGFIDPQGIPHPPITNLAAFCREHGLDHSSMRRLAAGRKKIHHGWTHVSDMPLNKTPKRQATYQGFVNPAGETVAITNLTGFCRENGLNQSNMYKLITGGLRKYRGWTYQKQEVGL